MINREILFHHGFEGGRIEEVPEGETEGVPDGENYDAWRTKILTPNEFNDLSPLERIKYKLLFACLAPSTHNTQPWAFKMGENGDVDVFLDKDRVLPASDPKGRQAAISVGAAISLVEIVSGCYGVEAIVQAEDIEVDSVAPYSENNKDRLVKIAEIIFSESTGEAKNLSKVEAILSRRVNRTKEYDPYRNVDDELINYLADMSTDNVGVHIFRRGDGKIESIANVQGMIDAFVGNLPAFSRELGDWMKQEDTRDYYGMPTSTFLLEADFGKEVIQALKGEISNKPSHVAGVAKNSKEGIQNASIVGMVTVDNNSVSSWVEAGMVMGKIGVLLEENGIENAYFAGIAEASDLNLVLVSGVIQSLLKNKFSTSGVSVGLFRSGYRTSERPPHSPRAPLGSFMVK